MFQRSALPKEGCNEVILAGRKVIEVSTLSPPEGGLQLRPFQWHSNLPFVSTLSPPEGGLQRLRETPGIVLTEFQRSALPKEGCNLLPLLDRAAVLVSTLSPPEGGLQRRLNSKSLKPAPCFNAQPSRRRAATKKVGRICLTIQFQRSALPKEGCNAQCRSPHCLWDRFNAQPSRRRAATEEREQRLIECLVSTLSPPEGGLQRIV